MTPWDRKVDFLVVGSGAAGMTAALRADDLCGETLVIEKAPVYGGSTALSGGVVWVPNNPGMKEHGVSDSPEEALTYIEAVTQGSSSTERLRAYVATAPRMMAALAERSHASPVSRCISCVDHDLREESARQHNREQERQAVHERGRTVQ